ncbi:MAG: nitroreductase family protein [Candidatus Pacearchaeota archaeon]
MNLTKAIKTRASIREFSDKSVKYDKLIDAIEAANLAPSPGNLSILKYIIIDEEETIQKIAKACQQEFIKEAQFIVVVCSDSKQAAMYDKRADRYIHHHAGAAVENFLLKITDMGLASCWVGAFSEITLKNILKIPENIEIEVILPIGYAKKKTKQKPKNDLGNLVYFDVWKNKYKKKDTQVRRSDF